MATSNPYKVNQYTGPDPRQALFINYYFTKESETFANAYQSAKKAGYEEEYCQSITAPSNKPKWLVEYTRTREEYLVTKAEENMKEFLNIDEKADIGLVRVKADLTKFTLDRLAKDRYAERKELTDKNGGRLFEEQQAKDIIKALE